MYSNLFPLPICINPNHFHFICGETTLLTTTHCGSHLLWLQHLQTHTHASNSQPRQFPHPHMWTTPTHNSHRHWFKHTLTAMVMLTGCCSEWVLRRFGVGKMGVATNGSCNKCVVWQVKVVVSGNSSKGKLQRVGIAASASWLNWESLSGELRMWYVWNLRFHSRFWCLGVAATVSWRKVKS